MKNLYSFSDNPLNTDRLLYIIKKAPKAGTGKPKVSLEKQKAATKIAETMTKLKITITEVDKKIKHTEREWKKYGRL